MIKWAFEESPTLPEQKETWDVNTVLDMLNTWVPLDKLTLKELTLKLVMLIALLTGQRCQTIHALDITCMSLKDDKCTFFCKYCLKTHTPRNPLGANRTSRLPKQRKFMCNNHSDRILAKDKLSQRKTVLYGIVYRTVVSTQACEQRHNFTLDKVDIRSRWH